MKGKKIVCMKNKGHSLSCKSCSIARVILEQALRVVTYGSQTHTEVRACYKIPNQLAHLTNGDLYIKFEITL